MVQFVFSMAVCTCIVQFVFSMVQFVLSVVQFAFLGGSVCTFWFSLYFLVQFVLFGSVCTFSAPVCILRG